ncbi:MAG TPA: alkaline phosphatase family protein [Planctomycetota bacterium]|nr:alkaline phosphatase family protein [Planctomycetota bacterium]
MNLPRWTAYPALAALLGMAWFAIPHPVKHTPPKPRTPAANPGVAAPVHERVVVLGIDGLDPELLAETIQRFPALMTNFSRLIDEQGLHSLSTSTPPQSPVAWSNFITGLNPGGHGVFDFIHRDPMTRGPIPSTTKSTNVSTLSLWGDWQFPISGGDSESNRTGVAFWTVLARHGIPADVWRMPANFPVELADGLSFSGMMTPAIDSAYGESTFYTEVALTSEFSIGKKIESVRVTSDGSVSTRLYGPSSSPFKKPDREGHAQPVTIPLSVRIDHEAGAAALEVDGQVLVLEPGEWSVFIPVAFPLMPAGLSDVHGIVRFYLRSLEPFQMYASPVNIDPENPITPVSEPASASEELASRDHGIGPYYTQGMPEDVSALKAEVLTVPEFMRQADLVHHEGERMLDYALDHYLKKPEGGFLFFYFSTVDLCSHMMWRHGDVNHPHHDPVIAAQSSEEWTKRAGSTWKDSIFDLYIEMDRVVGHLRDRLPQDVTLIVMSDHGFAPYTRKFSLNTWLLDEGYLVLKPGHEREKLSSDPEAKPVFINVVPDVQEAGKPLVENGDVDWSKTRAYGIGFNGLYLNLAGREKDDPSTKAIESGIVTAAEAPALLAEIKAKLEAYLDNNGVQVVLRCDLASTVYKGARALEAPDMIVGYNSGYDNSDEATQGRIPHDVLSDNLGGTFNGSHLMAPDVVMGTLLSNRKILPGSHGLEDLTVEILARYGIAPQTGMSGHRVLEQR